MVIDIPSAAIEPLIRLIDQRLFNLRPEIKILSEAQGLGHLEKAAAVGPLRQEYRVLERVLRDMENGPADKPCQPM